MINNRPLIWNGIKRQRKIKYIHDAKQYLKRRWNYPIKTQTRDIIDRTLPTSYKRAGRVLFVTSLFLEGRDIYKERAFKASHALDLIMLGAGFIAPPVGLTISIAYFLTDVGLMIYNYNKTGNAKGIGDYVNEFVDHKGWLENGVIWDLTPLLGSTNDSLPIVNPGLIIN